MNAISGVYRIVIDKKSYVGSSKDVNTRIKSHKKMLENNSHPNKKMQSNYNNTKECTSSILDENINDSQLEKYENYYIGKFDCIDNGYNSILANRGSYYLSIKEKDYTLVSISELSKEMNIPIKNICVMIAEGMPYTDIGNGKKRFIVQVIKKWICSNKTR